jgi:RNA polymerase sigma factor (TIGR02999 family)
MSASPQELTRLLADWRRGDRTVLAKLMPLVYEHLHRLAHRAMRREGPGHTLQTTALVHEACLRLMGPHPVDWQSRAHFYAVAAQVMRRLLVDHARGGQTAKRGGGARRLTLDEAALVSPEPSAELLALDEALQKLAALDERKSRLVELRYFGGLTAEETAEVLGVSLRTAEREWLKAKLWLYRELTGKDGDAA